MLLFDHFVGNGEQVRWYVEVERLRSVDVDDQAGLGLILRSETRGCVGLLLAGVPGMTLGFIGSRPSRYNFFRASLRARRMASAFSRTFLSEGFS